jgi:YegS/Rv2252/BmrU family lipid kinase
MDRRVLIIFNPACKRGGSQQWQDRLRQLAAQSIDRLQWRATERPGHAIELASEAAENGFGCVVAAGGDGTAHEVVNGLMQIPSDRRPSLGLLPLGSGNDIAFACGLLGDTEALIASAWQGPTEPIDIGWLRDDRGRSVYFDNSVGMLLDAAVNIHSHRIRKLRGFPMYLLATFKALWKNYEPTRLQLQLDDSPRVHTAILAAVGNGPREGGGFVTNPDAVNHDGWLDLVVAEPVSRLQTFLMLPAVIRGRHGAYRNVHFHRFRRMLLQADRPVPIHIDGELWADFDQQVRQLEIELRPGALQVVRPGDGRLG